ncbi:MAG: potassium transporter KtrB [Planctomycetes bacterium]|nr:potassium transporter KtrB [Planctomycetota bacterium]
MRRSTVFLARLSRALRRVQPAKLAFLGYLSYIVGGWLVLSLPLLQKGPGVGALDGLFIATSAVSTTGLTTVSVTDSYNFAGQLVVLLLIQLGGIGYMTFGSFVILSRKTDLSEVRADVGKIVFSLPASFRIDKFIRSVVRFTLSIELVGALALYFVFRKAGTPEPVWSAVFHSVSAFCTAGFGLYNDSLVGLAGNFWLNAIVAALSYLGAIGFIVCVDVWRVVRGKVPSITLTSKIILWSTVWLTVGGALLLYVGEPSIQSLPVNERLMAAFFQVMTSITTVGFNTINIAELSKASLLILIVLMVVGASPSGTGGGLKSTTLSAIFGVMRSAIAGRKEVRFWGRPVPAERVWTAVAGLGFYLVAFVIGTYLLELTEGSSFVENLFEAASALGTVGLSMGITASLTSVGKLVVILLMFCGRLGPLTFSMALFFRAGLQPDRADNDLAI